MAPGEKPVVSLIRCGPSKRDEGSISSGHSRAPVAAETLKALRNWFSIDGRLPTAGAIPIYLAPLPKLEVTMKKPEELTLDEIRDELRQLGMTPRLITLIANELSAVEQRVRRQRPEPGQPKPDPLVAQFNVLRQYGMTNGDIGAGLNRKGTLFIVLTTREEYEKNAA
jgi:hypothetical protein